MGIVIHGHANRGKLTPTYHTWYGMLTRCENPKATDFRYYGGRGIIVCPEWHDFATFLADMGERPNGKTLDRRNGDGNYCPENCRWATAQEQAANKKPITHCPQGHEYNPVNAYRERSGSWKCRICKRARGKIYRARKKVLA